MTFTARPSAKVNQIAGFDGRRTREGDDSQKLQWLVTGVDTQLEAETAILNEGLPANSLDFTPPGGATKTTKLQTYSWEEASTSEKAWIFTAEYSFEKLDEDEYDFSVTTSGGTIRVHSSFNTTSYPAPSETAPDFKNAIDVQDGRPRGVDIIIPAIRYTLTYRLTRPADPIAFAHTAASITGTTNDDTYFGSSAGELLFLGMDGRFGNQINPELQFSWAKSANATLTIGDIASVSKLGHDYLWILYEDEDTGSGASAFVRQKARVAYVERVYQQADHSVLGLLI